MTGLADPSHICAYPEPQLKNMIQQTGRHVYNFFKQFFLHRLDRKRGVCTKLLFFRKNNFKASEIVCAYGVFYSTLQEK